MRKGLFLFLGTFVFSLSGLTQSSREQADKYLKFYEQYRTVGELSAYTYLNKKLSSKDALFYKQHLKSKAKLPKIERSGSLLNIFINSKKKMTIEFVNPKKNEFRVNGKLVKLDRRRSIIKQILNVKIAKKHFLSQWMERIISELFPKAIAKEKARSMVLYHLYFGEDALGEISGEDINTVGMAAAPIIEGLGGNNEWVVTKAKCGSKKHKIDYQKLHGGSYQTFSLEGNQKIEKRKDGTYSCPESVKVYARRYFKSPLEAFSFSTGKSVVSEVSDCFEDLACPVGVGGQCEEYLQILKGDFRTTGIAERLMDACLENPKSVESRGRDQEIRAKQLKDLDIKGGEAGESQ